MRETELQIDRNALDDELVHQPSKFLQASRDYAEALSVRDQAKQDVEVSKAEASLRIRRQCEQDGEKVTEAIIAARVETDKKCRQAVTTYLDSKKACEEALALKEAFMQRSYVLKDLAALYIAGYYGSDSVRGGAARELRDHEYSNNRAKLAEKRRRL